MAAMVSQMHAGAIIIYKKNMVSPTQLTAFITATQAHSTIPMLVTMDEEGGNVDRLGDMQFNTPLPSREYGLAQPAIRSWPIRQGVAAAARAGVSASIPTSRRW